MVYAYLADGRDKQQMMELDLALAPSEEEAQKTIDQANMEAMQALQAQLGSVQGPPARPRARAKP